MALLVLFTTVPQIAGADGNQASPINSATRCANFMAKFNLSNGSNVVSSSSLPVFCSATELITRIISYGLIIGGSVAVIFLMVGGFWYLTSAGNEEQAEKGRKTLINSIIGLVVIILAATIVRIVAGTLNLGK